MEINIVGHIVWTGGTWLLPMPMDDLKIVKRDRVYLFSSNGRILGFDSRVEFYTGFNMLWGFQYKADTTIWQSLN